MGKTDRLALSLAKGFTLIELLIVIAIIGIISTLGVGSYQTSLKRARDAQRKSDLQQVRAALEIYRADQQKYPLGSQGNGYQIAGCNNCLVPSVCAWGVGWTCGGSSYMDKLPVDPKSVNYRYASDNTTYTLEACLENPNDPQGITLAQSANGWTASDCSSGKVLQTKNP